MEEEIQVQVDDNSPSIEHTLRPISYTSWLLGVGVARPRKCSKAVTIILRIIHLAVWIFTVIYDIISMMTIFEDEIFEYLYIMDKIICYISTFYYIFHGIRQYNKWPELMDKIKKLDRKIRREITMNDQHIKIIEALAILVTFACCPLSLFVMYYYYFHLSLENDVSVSDISFLLMVAQSLINSFVFDVIVYVLYYRFQTVNKLIGQLDELSSAPWIALRIRHIRELHTGICDLVIMVNDIYGFQLLFCSLNCFTMVVTTLFKLYVLFVDKEYSFALINNILGILYTTQFGLMCWICTLARQESDKTGRSIYEILLNSKSVNLDTLNGTKNQSNLELRLPLQDPDSEQNSNWGSGYNLNYVAMENLLSKNLNRDCIRNEVNDFSVQLQQHRVAFIAYDFFEINNALFTGFVGVIIAYIIISIQFHGQPKISNKNNEIKALLNKLYKKLNANESRFGC